jgi:hypothetical protein
MDEVHSVEEASRLRYPLDYTRREKSLWTTTRTGKKHRRIERVIDETSTNNKHVSD